MNGPGLLTDADKRHCGTDGPGHVYQKDMAGLCRCRMSVVFHALPFGLPVSHGRPTSVSTRMSDRA